MSSSPHDALFKSVFGHPEHARGALRTVLPVAVGDALDWAALAPYPGSFIDPALTGRHTDLVFSIRWHGGDDALVYVLFEHQSSSDHQMPFRLLRYLVRIWEDWLAKHPRATHLPVVIPIVLYHGDEAWSAPRSFDSLFTVPEPARPALAAHLVQLTYLVDDLSEVPDHELRTRAMSALGRLTAVCFKHARTRADLLELLASWADVLREVLAAPNGLEALARVMRYILLVNEHVAPQRLQAFLDHVVGPDAKDTIMTAGEKLIQLGEQRGEQRGKQQGIQIGASGTLLSVLKQRFGHLVDAAVEQRIVSASVDQIDAWTHRVFSAGSLTELLAD